MENLTLVSLLLGAAFAGLFFGAKIVCVVLRLDISSQAIAKSILVLFAFCFLCYVLMGQSETALGGMGLFTVVGLGLGIWFFIAVVKKIFRQ